MSTTELIDASENANRTPGLLLEPFKWAATSVMRLAFTEPRLLMHLTDLDKLRLHAIAFYLAYRGNEAIDNQEAALLATGRSRDILESATGSSPRRLLLRRSPEYALEREEYAQLVEISRDDIKTQLLMTHRRITGSTIAMLAAVPLDLCRSPLLDMLKGDLLKLAAVGAVCAWLKRRWNVDAAAQYAQARSHDQLRQLTIDRLRMLPPISLFPPRVVGKASLIETIDDLRRAGRVGKNCLGKSARDVSFRHSAFYVWQQSENNDETVYIRLNKPYGLGWFLEDMLLPENKPVGSALAKSIEESFAEAGFEREAVATALTALLHDDDDDDDNDDDEDDREFARLLRDEAMGID